MPFARARSAAAVPIGIACLLSGARSGPVSAAVACVGSAADLQAALDAAETNGENDEIRIREGVYASPAGGFVYFAADNHDLTLRGGFELVGPDCVQTGGAAETVLDGEGLRPVLLLEDWGDGDVVQFTVERLTLRRGSDAGTPGNGLAIWNANVASISSFVHHCILAGNHSSNSGGFQIASGPGTVRFEDNLVAGNSATGAGAGYLNSQAPAPTVGVTAVHNTFAGNDDVNGYGGLSVSAPLALLADNILWGNDGYDLYLVDSANQTYDLERNDLGEVSGTFSSTLGNLTAAPGFVGGGDYRLRVVSPLIDAGTQAVATIAATDVADHARLVGAEVDLGAYESWELFLDSFEDGDTLAWSSTEPPPP